MLKNYLEFNKPSTDSNQKLLQLMPIRSLFLHCHELKSVHSPLCNTELSLGQRTLLVWGDSHLLPPTLPASTRKEVGQYFGVTQISVNIYSKTAWFEPTNIPTTVQAMETQ